MESPGMRSRFCIVRVKESANGAFAARHADDDFVFHDQRRTRRGVAAGCGVIEHLRLPQLVAGFRVHRDHMHVERVHEESRPQDGQSAVVSSAAVEGSRRIAMLVHPELPAGQRVERINGVLRPREIHDAVDDQRRRLELLGVPSLEEPLHRRFFTFCAVIWLSLLNRHPLYVLEYISQLPGSWSAFKSLSYVTGRPCEYNVSVAAARRTTTAHASFAQFSLRPLQ